MSRTYQLQISSPCAEDWGTMLPEEKGKFCLSCQKSVIDFSGMSDAAIVRVLEQSTGDICGRLRASQQQRNIEAKANPGPWIRNSLSYGLSILCTLSAQYVWAVRAPIDITPITNGVNPSSTNFVSDNDTIFLKGRIIDYEKEGVPGAVIDISGTSISVISDVDGEFKLPVPVLLTKNQFDIIIATLGYKQTYRITPEMMQQRNIFAFDKESEEIWTGDVTIVIKKRHWWQFWKSKRLK